MSTVYEPSDPPVYAPTYVSRGLFDLLSEGEGAVVEADACNVYVTTRNGVTYYSPRLVS